MRIDLSGTELVVVVEERVIGTVVVVVEVVVLLVVVVEDVEVGSVFVVSVTKVVGRTVANVEVVDSSSIVAFVVFSEIPNNSGLSSASKPMITPMIDARPAAIATHTFRLRTACETISRKVRYRCWPKFPGVSLAKYRGWPIFVVIRHIFCAQIRKI